MRVQVNQRGYTLSGLSARELNTVNVPTGANKETVLQWQ
jgi:hypothetical protein